jgi:hypothetical protein
MSGMIYFLTRIIAIGPGQKIFSTREIFFYMNIAFRPEDIQHMQD